MDTKFSLLSVKNRGIRINDRRDLVLNYYEQLGADFSIVQVRNSNFSSLESIKEMCEGDILISRSTMQSKGLMILVKKDAPTIEQIIIDWKVYILQDQRYGGCHFRNLCFLWNDEGAAH